MNNESMNYVSPTVEILDVEVEKGFAVSNPYNAGEWESGSTDGWQY